MIMVDIKDKPQTTFPILARGKISKILVAFTSNTTGIVIEKGETRYKPFQSLTGIKNLESSEWIILSKNEIVTLQNQ